MFFNDIPNHVLIEILSNLAPKDLSTTALLSKKLKMLSNSNALWREFLKEGKQDQQSCNPNSTQNKTTYIEKPEVRKVGYIHYDQAGRDYLNGLVDQELQNNQNLTHRQKKYLRLPLTKELIQTEQLTIKQVLSSNFGKHTIEAIKDYGMKSKDIQGLDEYQIEVMRKTKLTRKQVLSQNFSYCSAEAMIKAIKNGAKFEDIEGFDDAQIRGVHELKLTREQVQSPNFGFHTTNAIEYCGMKFEDIEGLNKDQIKAMRKKLEDVVPIQDARGITKFLYTI